VLQPFLCTDTASVVEPLMVSRLVGVAVPIPMFPVVVKLPVPEKLFAPKE